jgi:hypothetical protein
LFLCISTFHSMIQHGLFIHCSLKKIFFCGTVNGAVGLLNLPFFHLSQCLFLSIRCISYKQQIVRSSFLIQHAKQCLLMGELSPLALSVSIDRSVAIPAIKLFLLDFWFLLVWMAIFLLCAYVFFFPMHAHTLCLSFVIRALLILPPF